MFIYYSYMIYGVDREIKNLACERDSVYSRSVKEGFLLARKKSQCLIWFKNLSNKQNVLFYGSPCSLLIVGQHYSILINFIRPIQIDIRKHSSFLIYSFFHSEIRSYLMRDLCLLIKTLLRRSHTPAATPSPVILRILNNSFPGTIVMGCEQFSSSKPSIGVFMIFHILQNPYL